MGCTTDLHTSGWPKEFRTSLEAFRLSSLSVALSVFLHMRWVLYIHVHDGVGEQGEQPRKP